MTRVKIKTLRSGDHFRDIQGTIWKKLPKSFGTPGWSILHAERVTDGHRDVFASSAEGTKVEATAV